MPLLFKKLLINLRSHLLLKLGDRKIKPILKDKIFIKNQRIFTLKHRKKQTQTPVINVNKPISVRCKNVNGSIAEFYCLLSTADRQTSFWSWEDNQNNLFQKHILKQLQKLSGLA